MITEILESSPANLNRAADILNSDGIVGIPTETVYGLAGNAFSEEAVTRIFAAKERPKFDPLIVHIAPKSKGTLPFLGYLEQLGLTTAHAYTPAVAEKIEKICTSVWPGPFTLVLPKTDRVPDLVTSGLPSVAVRMPAHPVAQALLKLLKYPLAAPSANRFGRISPTSAADVKRELEGRVPLILDGGPCSVGLESTVLRIDSTGRARLLRPGAVSPERLEAILGSHLARSSSTAANTSGQSPNAPAPSPGMAASHYAPQKRLHLLSASIDKLSPDQLKTVAGWVAGTSGPVGLLLFSPGREPAVNALARNLGRVLIPLILSPTGQVEEAARNLFRGLRQLDDSNAVVLVAEACPWTEGLGFAISDRLGRASN